MSSQSRPPSWVETLYNRPRLAKEILFLRQGQISLPLLLQHITQQLNFFLSSTRKDRTCSLCLKGCLSVQDLIREVELGIVETATIDHGLAVAVRTRDRDQPHFCLLRKARHVVETEWL